MTEHTVNTDITLYEGTVMSINVEENEVFVRLADANVSEPDLYGPIVLERFQEADRAQRAPGTIFTIHHLQRWDPKTRKEIESNLAIQLRRHLWTQEQIEQSEERLAKLLARFPI